MADQKISVYSLPDLKNTTDDALPNFLTSLKFQQNHMLTDVRLCLGYAAVAIGAATFYFDYYYDWKQTKDMTLWAVVAYFILNSALTGWIWLVESGKIFEGSRNGNSISIASSTTKHVPTYYLDVYTTEKGSSQKNHRRIEAPFTRWFTADGKFVAPQFQSWLAGEVPLVKEAVKAKK